MSVVDLTLSFWSKQAQAAKASFGEARGKALNNDLGLDDTDAMAGALSLGLVELDGDLLRVPSPRLRTTCWAAAVIRKWPVARFATASPGWRRPTAACA